MNSQLREQVLNLRVKEELSYGEIKKRLGVPKSTLSYWLRELPLSEERILELRRKGWSKGEASRERFRTAMRQKRELTARHIYEAQRKHLSDTSRDTFFVAGLMLYLGEGEKTTTSRICLANTNPRIIKFFIKWMEEFLGIRKNEMRSQLQLYGNMDLEAEKGFWRTTTGFSASQFYKPYIHKLRPASFSYKESYRHGTCNISYLNVPRKTKLMMAIQAFLDLYM
ncbi:MAG: Uncharacterized protein G01um101433_1043 [Parcubacteria group bacterium Gr01-1014_33]|nr:MAG: Uncharacterized protein G01um101433_1043 [Parcubacteria group bacterium Gr01-1014_33]